MLYTGLGFAYRLQQALPGIYTRRVKPYVKSVVNMKHGICDALSGEIGMALILYPTATAAARIYFVRHTRRENGIQHEEVNTCVHIYNGQCSPSQVFP